MKRRLNARRGHWQRCQLGKTRSDEEIAGVNVLYTNMRFPQQSLYIMFCLLHAQPEPELSVHFPIFVNMCAPVNLFHLLLHSSYVKGMCFEFMSEKTASYSQ